MLSSLEGSGEMASPIYYMHHINIWTYEHETYCTDAPTESVRMPEATGVASGKCTPRDQEIFQLNHHKFAWHLTQERLDWCNYNNYPVAIYKVKHISIARRQRCDRLPSRSTSVVDANLCCKANVFKASSWPKNVCGRGKPHQWSLQHSPKFPS